MKNFIRFLFIGYFLYYGNAIAGDSPLTTQDCNNGDSLQLQVNMVLKDIGVFPNLMADKYVAKATKEALDKAKSLNSDILELRML